jgi:2-polyprenyl-3-methyl-5-hydroxy-6-metoxy-1,4-benzoquinol methylase/glycosyltransferase involved in cell wall biosynthesis
MPSALEKNKTASTRAAAEISQPAGRSKLRLAYFSPLNPQPSGIADYSEELLPYLAEEAEIDLFVDGFKPANPAITASFRVLDYRKTPATLESLSSYDAVVYHVGNDHRYHSGIFRAMQRHPGIAVFHDFALQDFFLGLARQENSLSIYLDELEACHGKRESVRAAEYLSRGADPPHPVSGLDFPLNCRLANSAEGIIVHSEWSLNQLSAIAPGTPIARINHHITSRAAASPVSARSRGTNATVNVASFGLITPEKGIERALRALSALREEFNFHYTLVGSADNFPGVYELIEKLGLSERVTVTGYVKLEEFERRIAESDIAINLRERPVGATSGSLCRIMAAGLAAIVSNVGAFAELPNDAVVKIDHNDYADALLEAYLRKLFADKSLRDLIGQNARRHVLAEHRIEDSAAGYLGFIREVIKRRPRKELVDTITTELAALGVNANHEQLLRKVAAEVALVAPAGQPQSAKEPAPLHQNVPASGNGHHIKNSPALAAAEKGRVPKLEGIDYKRAAIEYLGKLDPERNHHLRTKPFYNLANKPAKYKGEGIDEDMHRHFCDFANMALTLALPAGAKILDVGCGSGWLSEYFARLGYDVKGVDISPDLIAMSRERVARVPYGVDHETPLRCEFAVHDVELAALSESFDLIICYDSLHHFEDERAVMRHLAAMLEVGGLLFILEGQKPDDNSVTADELRSVMQEFGTLESPFSQPYLRALLSENSFAVVGDYVAVDGLFEREMLEGSGDNLTLPLRTVATDYHYLTCMKVVEHGPASSVPDSRNPGLLRADIARQDSLPLHVGAGQDFEVPVSITNSGDTLWLTGQTVRAGIVMPGVRIFDEVGAVIGERHGHPMLPRVIAPGQTLSLKLECTAPVKPGSYTAKFDLVDQHICWFEERGSRPLVFSFEVKPNNP